LCIVRPVAVPKISCSLFAHEILTAATPSAPLTPPPAAVASLPLVSTYSTTAAY